MRQPCRFTGIMWGLMFAVGTVTADEKKDEPTKPGSDTDKISIARELTGKLTKISSTGRSFTLHVEYLDLKPNGGYRGTANAHALQHLAREQEQIARLQTQIMHTRNPAKRLAKLQKLNGKIQREQFKSNSAHLPYHVVTRHQDVQLVAAEDVKVRRARPPADFDEKGNPRKRTPEELRKLKGPEKLWGYPGEWSNLQTGQMVKVFLGRKKNGGDDRNAEEKKRSEVVLIHILEDAKKK